ncbi:MAG: hypothetical protein PHR16_07740 [Methylovulum sp.]|nr:hypothetical protein [Methylovulum sp.]
MSWSTHITMIASNDYTPDTRPSENAKTLYFSDRSGAFGSNLEALLDLAAIGSLLFISDYGYEELDSNSEEFDEDEDAIEYVIKNVETVIKPEKFDALIADIDTLFLWCSNNVATTSSVFEDNGFDEEDVRRGIEEADKYTIDAFDDQSSSEPEFLFCALKSIQALLKYAKENNTTVFYENLGE